MRNIGEYHIRKFLLLSCVFSLAPAGFTAARHPVPQFRIRFMEPLGDRCPAYRFRSLQDRSTVSHLQTELDSNRYLNEIMNLASYASGLEGGGTKVVYIAVYNRPSRIGTPYVVKHRGRWAFQLEGRRIEAPVYYLSLTGPYGNRRSVQTQSFQNAFIHELGHIILNILVPDYPKSRARSRGMTSVTDQVMAFDEGFAQMLECFYKFRMGHYNDSNYLANISFWHRMEFARLRTIALQRNLFVWDEWTRDRLMRLQREGYGVLRSPDFLPMQKLRSQAQMLACEGVAARILLDIAGTIMAVDSGGEHSLTVRYNWPVVENAFRRIMVLVRKNKIASIKQFCMKIMQDPGFIKYRRRIWKIVLEDSYYAFGSKNYAVMYRRHTQGVLPPGAYEDWKRKVLAANMGYFEKQ